MRLSVIILAVLFSVAPALASRWDEAVMIDSFERLTCDDMLARVDGIISRMSEDPKSRIYLVLSFDSSEQELARSFQRQLLYAFKHRAPDISRISFYVGEPEERLRVHVWLEDAGVAVPEKSRPWPKDQIDITRKNLVARNYGGGLCPGFVPDDYSHTVRSNPGLIAEVVIYPYLLSSAIDDVLDWRKTLTEKYSVPKEQVRIIVKHSTPNFRTEFCIVPRKQH